MSRALTNSSDAELLRLMLAGDSMAFASLYDRHQACIYRFALRMTDSDAMAGDVTHDVFLALVRDGNQFDPERGTLGAYLYGIARNRILKLLKRERGFVSLNDGEDETTLDQSLIAQSNPLLELTRSETIETVRQAVLALPAHYREVVLLCNMHEMNYEQAAGVIGCAVGTVRSRLHRARHMLLEKLHGLNDVETAPRTDTESGLADSRGLTQARIAI
jgi:RNA polymerase sigma-70 factor (ECF subfamily)